MDRGAGAGQAVGLWWRVELRRRLASLAVLGLLAGLAAAVSLSALAGARRSDAAWDRLGGATRSADAVVFASQADIYAPDWTPVAELPYVEAAGSFGLPFLQVVDGPEGIDLSDLGAFSVPFGGWRDTVDRPVIIEGRAPDPTNPHEVLAVPDRKNNRLEVGQTYTFALPSAEQMESFEFFGELEGERVEVEVVGMGRSTFELAVIPGDSGSFFVTPAFDDRYSGPATFIDNLLVRFEPGEGSVSELERDARQLLDSPTLPVLDTHAAAKRVTNGTELEASGLALFGLAVAVAGAVLVGQALVRSVRAAAGDVPTLHAMGFTTHDSARALAMPHVVVVVVGAVVAFAGAVALSPRYPIGVGRGVDPDVGIHVDWLVLGLGTVAMVAALGVTIVTSALRVASHAAEAPSRRRSGVVDALAAIGARPALTVGASLALEPGRGRRTLPTRPALAGMVVGVVGVIGAQTLLAGIDDAIDNPARFGASWDIEVAPVDFPNDEVVDRSLAVVDAIDGVDARTLSARALVRIDGVTQPTYATAPTASDLDFAVLRGRRPAADGEIALGPETASSYGVDVGDEVTVSDFDGGDRRAEVVGIALLPTTPHSSYDQGAWVSVDDLEALAGAGIAELRPGAPPDATAPVIPTVLLDVAPSADVDEVVAALNEQLEPLGMGALPTTEPIDIANLRNVRSLPLLFALFTLTLALGTLTHVCVSVVRRRSADLAVLRALGMTPRNVRAALSWQATTLSVIGLLVGLPVGVVVGRVIWRVIAENTPLLFAAPWAGLAVALAIPVTVLLANVVALWPGRQAARVRPAQALRAE